MALVDPFGIFGGGRKKKKQKDAAKKAAKAEEARQQQLRRDEMERAIFQTTEGQGIAESASISLGFDDDEDDLFGFGSTGLVI